MPSAQIYKVWNTVATFATYKEADEKRNELALKNEDSLVKVRRSNLNGGIYRVKQYIPPVKKIEENQDKNKQSKKRQNTKRYQKNVNKKIRNRSEK